MPNALAGETSPYLLQHKDNPVDWQPWGSEALARAKAQNKPILLSVGYAACHWCHVMAHESFEDPAIAALMNELFVNIKVDREERPDLDSIYQTALAITGQQGGWPLTMFLTPDGKPFAGGTYFPPEQRYGRASFPDVLRQVAQIWREQPERIAQSQQAIMERLEPALNPRGGDGELSIAKLDEIAAQIVRMVDFVDGGFGEAPKFPNTPMLELLWRAYWRTGNPRFRQAVEVSLTHMCQGGIYDHLGGGFSRYSVDAEWLVPHFEKMLYDNAQLISLLTLVWQETSSPLFKQRVEETVQWVLGEMRHPDGGFYSSLDADSEGHEGKFYVWSRAEIMDVLGPADGEAFCSVYGVTQVGNFEGQNILNRLGLLELGDEAHEMRLKKMLVRLLERRASRVRPATDTKVLAEWNGLMIEALARAGLALDRSDWIEAARAAFAELSPQSPESLSRTPKGRALTPVAEDYANGVAAALGLYQATGAAEFLGMAAEWTRVLEARFSGAGGAFYQTSDNAPDIVTRSRGFHDNAVPPANATMLANYARLHSLTGRPEYRSRADAIAAFFAGVVVKTASGSASFLNAFETLVTSLQIVIVTAAGTDIAASVGRTATSLADPNKVLRWAGSAGDLARDHPAHGKTAVDGKPTAYVCRGNVCSLPVTEPEELAKLLQPAWRRRL